jgi:hypothetical protein
MKERGPLQRLALVTAASIAALVLSLTAARVARAEHSAISSSASWSSLEQHATTYASQIAGRAARVQCHGGGEWAALGLPADTLGAVRYLYDPYSMVIAATEDVIHLHESVCAELQRFGEAGQKPTSCATYDTVSRTVYAVRRVPRKVWSWKKVVTKGGGTRRVRISRRGVVTRRVPRTVIEKVPGPRVPCYGSRQPIPAGYDAIAVSLEVLAHEAIHIFDDRVGYPVQTQAAAESRAECFGMQFLAPLAHAFGADEADARALGRYYREVEYPKWGPQSPYWTPDCQPNSAMDITPSGSLWPRMLAPRNALSTVAPRAFPGPLVWGTRT